MLDFIYYPISAVLWFWHKTFGLLLGPDSGAAWALAIVFLVATVRVLLLKPALGQARAQQRLQRLQPQLAELRRKHGSDQQRLMTEMVALQREHGVNPFSALLPLLAQIPVFLGLIHVLRSFHAATTNYVFNTTDVGSFLAARLFGTPLSATLHTHPGIASTAIALTVVALILVSMVASHLTARLSIARASTPATGQAALMNRLLLWVLPAAAIFTAPFWPVGILVYFAAQSLSTLTQQYFLPHLLGSEPASPAKTP